jgi:hypothetical protein
MSAMPKPTGTMVSSVQVTPKLDSHDTPMCLSHALFLHALLDGLYYIWPIFFAIVSAVLTHIIRVVTPGVRKRGAAKPAAKTTATAEGESTAVTNPPVEVDIEAGQVGEEPPPYAPREPTPVEATPSTAPSAPTKPVVKHSSAYLFVVGTALFIPVLFSLLCLALSIQWLGFCQQADPYSSGWQAWYWILFFCPPALWARSGLACWAMLFRDLWGPAAKKKYVFEEHMVVGGVGFIIGCLIAFPFISEFLSSEFEFGFLGGCGEIVGFDR